MLDAFCTGSPRPGRRHRPPGRALRPPRRRAARSRPIDDLLQPYRGRARADRDQRRPTSGPSHLAADRARTFCTFGRPWGRAEAAPRLGRRRRRRRHRPGRTPPARAGHRRIAFLGWPGDGGLRRRRRPPPRLAGGPDRAGVTGRRAVEARSLNDADGAEAAAAELLDRRRRRPTPSSAPATRSPSAPTARPVAAAGRHRAAAVVGFDATPVAAGGRPDQRRPAARPGRPHLRRPAHRRVRPATTPAPGRAASRPCCASPPDPSVPTTATSRPPPPTPQPRQPGVHHDQPSPRAVSGRASPPRRLAFGSSRSPGAAAASTTRGGSARRRPRRRRPAAQVLIALQRRRRDQGRAGRRRQRGPRTAATRSRSSWPRTSPSSSAQGFAGGTPPDVFYVDAGVFADYAAAGNLYPYGDQIDDADDFYPSLRETLHLRRQVYCAPKDFSTLALQINTDLWTKAGLTDADIPTTWDELADRRRASSRPRTRSAWSLGPAGTGSAPSWCRTAVWVDSKAGEATADRRRTSRPCSTSRTCSPAATAALPGPRSTPAGPARRSARARPR